MEDKGDEISRLIDALQSTDKPEIRAAVDALIDHVSQSTELAETLAAILADPTRRNRWAIAYVLAHLPQPSQSALDVLSDGLNHPDPDIRWAVVLLLARLAKAHPHIVTRLLDLLAKGTGTQRRMAVYCIRAVELRDGASLQALLETLHDPDPMVRVATVTSLKYRSSLGPNVYDTLLQLFLEDPDVRVRNVAAVTLAQLGWNSQEFIVALTQASQTGDAQQRKAASAALELVQKKRSAPPGS
jgi:HEAT repeat protein